MEAQRMVDEEKKLRLQFEKDKIIVSRRLEKLEKSQLLAGKDLQGKGKLMMMIKVRRGTSAKKIRKIVNTVLKKRRGL